jgi:uncharacterized protein YndB with AHSA1/START domain
MKMMTKTMKPRVLLPAALFLMLSAGLSAAPNKDYPAIDDTSQDEAGGDRVIRLSADVAAPREEIWRLLTTAEGWKSFASAFAEVDLKVGGIIETSYNPKAQAGDPDNIKNEIVAYIPGRMLAIRCVQAPRNFKHQQEFYATATVFELVPGEQQTTRVVVTAVGYRPGAAYDDLFRAFRWGNAFTLDNLRGRFNKAAATSPADANDQKHFHALNSKP